MKKTQNLIGERFGKLVVIEDLGKRKLNRIFKCKCDCGKFSIVQYGSLKSGHSKSCGCLFQEKMTGNKFNLGHGLTKSKTYRSWEGMKQRCTNPNSPDYKNYGGRGISVCQRWLDSFENFLDDMGKRPDNKTLDRKNVNGNYEPSNCRWATSEEQRNNARYNTFLVVGGKALTVAQWARETGIKPITIYSRLKRGWNSERSIGYV